MGSVGLVVSVKHASEVSIQDLEQCSELFSEHYGIWGERAGPRLRGKRVRLDAVRIRKDYLFSDQCFLVTGILDGRFVGHILACRFPYSRIRGAGTVVWITQLVVHSGYRNQGLATKLVQNAFNPRSDYACGLVTSHPHAIRAFERATSMKVDPRALVDKVPAIIKESGIGYLQDRPIRVGVSESVINTDFFVDHTDILELLYQQPDWRLGTVKEGEEWIAAVFRTVNLTIKVQQ